MWEGMAFLSFSESSAAGIVLLKVVDYTEDKLIFGKTRRWRMFSVRHTLFDGEYVWTNRIELPTYKMCAEIGERSLTWFLTVILIFYMM